MKHCLWLRSIPLSTVLLSTFLTAVALQAQINTPDKIIKILEESPITYGIEIDEAVEGITAVPEQLRPNLHIRKTEEGSSLEQYELSPEASSILEKAEAFFADTKFNEALPLYRQVEVLEPDYSGVKTLIGDAYFNMKKPDSARLYLTEAIEMNFADYQAHWFLSSVELQLGNEEAAMRELTVAHVLNPGHKLLAKALKGMREKLGRTWDDWTFAPRYELADETIEEVRVRFAPGWMMYAITKALWEYEEGYVEEKGIEDRDGLQAMALKEREASMMFLYEYLAREVNFGEEGTEDSKKEELGNTEEADSLAKRLVAIKKEGLIDPFIYYEVLGKANPPLFSLMSRESVYHIASYVDKFH